MKRIFFIFILLVAINFASPNSQTLSQTLRHRIEFAQNDHTKELTYEELFKNKIKVEMFRLLLLKRIGKMDIVSEVLFNTS